MANNSTNTYTTKMSGMVVYKWDLVITDSNCVYIYIFVCVCVRVCVQLVCRVWGKCNALHNTLLLK